MSTFATLNLANYSTVWSDNFGSDHSLNTNLWPVAWGNADDFSFANGGLTLTSYASEGWANVGFMQADYSTTSGQGYGLYQMTASADNNQGVGICICMWPSDNVWPGPEIDLLEDWSDPTRQTAYATIHWKGAGNSNGQDIHQISINLLAKNTFAMDWEPNALTYYINGQEIFQVTGSEVPKDAADGGTNESFGAEVTAAGSAPVSSSVSLNIYSASYSAYTGGNPPPPTISLSAPGTVQEASPGAGVNVTETVAASGLSTVYEAVFTSAGVQEGGWTAVALNGSGAGSFTAHFAHTGDYAEAVNSTTAPTATGKSAAITITDPSIALSSPGTVKEASPGAGVNVTETISAPGLTTAYEAVFTSAGVQEGSWTKVTLNGSGAGSFTAHFAHTGDYAKAVNSTTAPTEIGKSSAITITDPTITLSAPGTVQEASPGAGVNVTETISAAGQTTAYEAVFTSAGVQEGAWTKVTLNGSGAGSFTAHFAHTGDYAEAVNSTTAPTLTGKSSGITITDPSSGPSNIKLTGDNLYTNSTAWTVVGTLSATDSNAVSFAMGVNPGHMFSIDGNKLLLDENMPAGEPASVGISIIATDNVTQKYAVQNITVGINTKTAAVAAAQALTPIAAATVAATTPVFITGSNENLTLGGGATAITFGPGAGVTWGGSGPDAYYFPADAGLQTIEDWSPAKGDTLTIDHALQGLLQESTSAGGTLLSFGDSSHGILLAGISSFDTSQIHWN